MKTHDDDCATIIGGILFISITLIVSVLFICYMSYQEGFQKGKLAEECNLGIANKAACNFNGLTYKGQDFN